MDSQRVFELATYQVRSHGNRLPDPDPWTFAYEFDEPRMKIYQQFDITRRGFSYLVIWLKIPQAKSESDQSQAAPQSSEMPVFTIGKSADAANWTLVFEYEAERREMIFFRPGKWMYWLEDRFDADKEFRQKRERFNGKEVEDSELFK